MSKPRILCVDDEPMVLEGLSLTLGRKYEVITAPSGIAALEVFKTNKFIPVIISDMRMAGMDGATLLAKVKECSPFTVRMLLTGHSDLDSAISAINNGQIFRFLVKPISPTLLLKAVESAVMQHQLIVSEKILLEQTLRGSIKVLTELLSLANPQAFGRANRIKQNAVKLATKINLASTWQIEISAMLSHIGYLTLPQEMVNKIYAGEALNEEENNRMARLPDINENLLLNIPRLEDVRSILMNQGKNFDGTGYPDNGLIGESIPIGSRILKIVTDFDSLELNNDSLPEKIKVMNLRNGNYDSKLLEAFCEILGTEKNEVEIRHLPISLLKTGMRFAQDIQTPSGVLIVPSGYELTDALLQRIKNYPEGNIKEPLAMIIAKPQALEIDEKNK